ncbi:MAG TPA: Mur ligase family protein, partial [Hyphomicrobiales bacterium]|nr:Mur ligase family protein [Hyphomicrobiales bacterium]
PSPVRIGTLELLGVKLTPPVLRSRGLIFVESYWRLHAPTRKDWRIEFQAVPEASTNLKAWGASSDHDPCDWMWPTSRWQTGTIYRDTYSLRPDTIRHWQDSFLQLRVRLKASGERTPWLTLPAGIKFVLNPDEAFSVLKNHPPQYLSVFQHSLSSPPGTLWTAEQLQRITGGKWLQPPPPGWCIGSISHKPSFLVSDAYPRPRLFVATDNRRVAHHELYSNLSGPAWDSHRRVPALQTDIDGALVAKNVDNLAPNLPLLQVADPLHALMELGVAARQRLRGKVVAVTGSAGKSSLCCMLARAMAIDHSVRTNATENYNSRCGLLHHLANTPEHTDLVILETAVSAINAPRFQHIKRVRPDIGIITNIAPSHLPSGKTLSYVAQRKGNIVEGIAKGGKLVLYRETTHFEYLSQRAHARGIDVVTYGISEDADIRLEYYDADTGVVRVRLSAREAATYRLQANGMHIALNSLACLAIRRWYSTFPACAGKLHGRSWPRQNSSYSIQRSSIDPR